MILPQNIEQHMNFQEGLSELRLQPKLTQEHLDAISKGQFNFTAMGLGSKCDSTDQVHNLL